MHPPSFIVASLLCNCLVAFVGCISNQKTSKCDVCRSLTITFTQGMIETETKDYEGGTSSSAKEKLGNYQDSELRFISIVENLCKSSDDKRKCISFMDKYEPEFENWFYTLRKEGVDIYNHICIQVSKSCCPAHHYGKDCTPCQGYKDSTTCSGHGKCSGDGSRTGNGSCICNTPYTGDLCDKCTENSYMAEDGTCSECHVSCAGSCINATAEGCQAPCKSGWKKDEKGVCIDIDECASQTHGCAANKRCVNVPGKFYCRDCYRSCRTCNGEGPNNCLECKPGFIKTDDNRCVDEDECIEGKHDCKPMTYCVNIEGRYKCKGCHKACAEGCTGPLVEDCTECKLGYKKAENGTGCVDINECSEQNDLCPPGKYCQNRIGSFKCKSCDEACHTCHGPGSYNCFTCSKGYTLVNGYCKDSTKIVEQSAGEEEDDL